MTQKDEPLTEVMISVSREGSIVRVRISKAKIARSFMRTTIRRRFPGQRLGKLTNRDRTSISSAAQRSTRPKTADGEEDPNPETTGRI
jgi:hypothetical protein